MYEFLMSNFDSIPFLIAFIAGILSFVSPCILPMVPIYFSYITGISVSNIKLNSYTRQLDLNARRRILLLSLSFIVGFGSIFFIVGVLLDTFVGDMLANPTTRYFAGGMIVLFGLHTLGFLNINILEKEQKTSIFDKYLNENSYLSNFLFGVSFALGWTPCVGPIFASIATLASSNKELGALLIVIYIFGLSLPFLLLSLFITKFIYFMDKVKSRLGLIKRVTGLLMITVGLLIASNKFSIFFGSF